MPQDGMPRGVRLFSGLGLICALLSTVAAQEVARLPIVDSKPGTPSLGAGARLGNNLYKNAEDTFDLVPLFLYEGRWLYAHGTSGGIHIYRNRWITFDAFVRYRFLHLDPDDDDSLSGLSERDSTLDGGLSFGVHGQWGEVKAGWLTDVLDVHDGEQAELTYRYRLDRGRWVLLPFARIEWQDEELTDYYFGVDPDEVALGRPVYSPGSAFNLESGIYTSFRATRNIQLFANTALKKWDDVIRDSPIVDEGLTAEAFFGVTYNFGSVHGPAKGASPDRESEWSWRVNYGYQTWGNIVGEVDRGQFRKNEDVDSKIAGVMFGRLLTQGPRVDYYGRLALYRHLEEPYQDDFNSYAAYIMAMGKGFRRWRKQPFFRWGFGFGFNYAEKVPAAEQVKQTNSGNKMNRFLSYLEMQLDFAIDAMTKDHSGVFRNCYLGATVVHRSGIFAYSDMLGGVEGGSDWLTAHVECLR
jgi:outer membrane scaffolding protein for murein synthesis (MipA/OmpV family)